MQFAWARWRSGVKPQAPDANTLSMRFASRNGQTEIPVVRFADPVWLATASRFTSKNGQIKGVQKSAQGVEIFKCLVM